MIPPIEDSVLQSNPKFALLHAKLTRNILNTNGSTKHHPAQKERDAVTASLKTARLRSAKLQLLRTSMNKIDLSPESTTATTKQSSRAHSRSKSQSQSNKQAATLPPELIELILLLSARLSIPHLPPQKLQLLESTPQWLSVPTHLPRICLLLSQALHIQALHLARILSPATNPSFLHRTIPSMLSTITTLQTKNNQASTALQEARMGLIPKITTVLGVYHHATTIIIQILESVQYGSSARFLKSQAEFANLSAKELSLEAKEKALRTRKMVYSEEARAALGNYMVHLRDAGERAGERGREARRVLWGYGVGREGGEEKERVMREVARVYGELRREIEEVGRDVERLKGK